MGTQLAWPARCLASALSCHCSKALTCSLRLLQSRGLAASRTVFSCPRAVRLRRYRFLEAGNRVGRSPNLHLVPDSSEPRNGCKNPPSPVKPPGA